MPSCRIFFAGRKTLAKRKRNSREVPPSTYQLASCADEESQGQDAGEEPGVSALNADALRLVFSQLQQAREFSGHVLHR